MSGSWEMALLRGIHLAAMLSMLGTQAFLAWVAPAAGTRNEVLSGRLVRLWRFSGIVAVLAGAVWLVMEAQAISGAGTWADLRDALPVVMGQTRFGKVVSARLALLLVAALLAGRGRWRVHPALALTAAAAMVEGLIGHAGAAEGATGNALVVSEALHLLAAGLWLGGLAPLWLAVRALPLAAAGAVCERFSPIGLGCVLVLAGTGAAQGLELIGSLPGLLGTAYGHLALLKIGLFLAALGLAAVNRLWLTDRVAAGAAAGRRLLLVSLAVETATGLAIILVAAFLASQVPGVHEQPVWPLPFRFSLATVTEDADVRREVIISVALIGAAVLLLAAALTGRRLRLAALAVLAGVLAWRGPSLSLLTARAYPTSFQTSPTGFSAASVVRGQAAYARNCVSCHGGDGAGDGPAAAGLRIRPADLTQRHVFAHSDGTLYWWLAHGIGDADGGMAMPGFGHVLAPMALWDLIDYIRAHADGVAVRQSGTYAVPVRAPAMGLACADPSEAAMSDLRGSVVHVVTAAGPEGAEPQGARVAGPRMVTLRLTPAGSGTPSAGDCVGADEAAWNAYAILAGVGPDRLRGWEFLIDPGGWLRLAAGPGGFRPLGKAVRLMLAMPRIAEGNGHGHHH
jgi:putative copper export protein/mono/diheme cytochrome c family protein